MSTSKILRASLLAAALGAALSAHALAIGINSHGHSSDLGATVNDTVDFKAGGYGPLSTLHYVIAQTATSLVGTGVYTGAGGTLDFSIVYKTEIVDLNAITYSGFWAATGGTGTYLEATGTGTFTTTFYNFNEPDVDTLTTFAGDVQAVPEPSALVALGLGGLALVRRRRKG